jgi:hypothetical protein
LATALGAGDLRVAGLVVLAAGFALALGAVLLTVGATLVAAAFAFVIRKSSRGFARLHCRYQPPGGFAMPGPGLDGHRIAILRGAGLFGRCRASGFSAPAQIGNAETIVVLQRLDLSDGIRHLLLEEIHGLLLYFGDLHFHVAIGGHFERPVVTSAPTGIVLLTPATPIGIGIQRQATQSSSYMDGISRTRHSYLAATTNSPA